MDARGQKRADPPNPMNQPVFVEGAEPGDALRVDILRIDPVRGTGWTRGALSANVVDPEAARDLPPRDRVDWLINREANVRNVLVLPADQDGPEATDRIGDQRRLLALGVGRNQPQPERLRQGSHGLNGTSAVASDFHFLAPDPDFLLSDSGGENHIGTRGERRGRTRPRAGETAASAPACCQPRTLRDSGSAVPSSRMPMCFGSWVGLWA